ncbi:MULTISPECIES: class I adenylate-forming enzyme family protein [Cytobacillus]|uniref:class I adenylate-forming enzyme family protein n=1 Tax=Cytobacillus TaxID=2675230 RepID=UPI00203B672E|nr:MULTISPECIES: AMP-binding protein [Cytobacillus]MCM3391068.1 AMP-binding protein [Cytobacillus oceanisediminis]UQX52689.1 AMP-binding protein [Cytobacillus pseudoceanisediminis]
MGATIHGVLERNARKFPEKDAFITASNRLTYADMNRTCNRLARYLQGEGIRRGDRIAVMSRNNEHFFYAFFACMKIGAIPMPMNVRLTPKELGAIFQNASAAGVLYEDELTETVTALKENLNFYVSIQDAVEASVHLSDGNLDVPIDSRDVCEILFTSGTTGTPKGVVFNHERILSIAAAVSVNFSLSHCDSMLTLMPLSHSAPLNTFFMSGFYCGASHVIGDFTPKGFLNWIQQEKTTFSFAAPVAYLLAAKDPDLASYDLSSMRVFAYGGGPLALASYHHVKKAFQNENFYQVYGLTEAGPNGILLYPEEHLEKAGSIGKNPTVNMEIRVVRPDGTDTAPNEYGEILLTGDSLMLGYDNNPDETNAAMKDGWLYTGDIAYRDKDGYFYIVDRKKDVIISGGVNIYPREVEEVLAKHDAVLESCVVGVPHEEWGETVKAVVVLKGDASEEELRAFAAEHLAEFKCPRIYSFVDELPRNASGKILKQQVKLVHA